MKRCAAILLCALAACGDSDPAPAPVGVGPEAAPPRSPAQAAPVVLSAPAEEPVAASAGDLPTDAATPAPAVLTFAIEPLGQFQVVTWREALRRAEARITADNAQDELRRVRQDLLGRRR